MRQVMMHRSNVSRLKVDLLFNKAAKCISAGLAKLKRLHNYMQNKAESSLEQLPEHRPVTEDELTAALNGTRVHTSSSEPYFWEHSSRSLPPCNSIPVDTAGRCRIFEAIVNKRKQQHASDDRPTTDDSNEDDLDVSCWQCNPDVCVITPDMVDGVIRLLNTLHSTSAARCFDLYTGLDRCRAEIKKNRLGHPLHCHLGGDCDSVLRPARILGCHYPYLRRLCCTKCQGRDV